MFLQKSLALWLEVGDPRGLIFAYTHLAAVTLTLEKNEEALGYAQQCLALSIDAADRWSQANALRRNLSLSPPKMARTGPFRPIFSPDQVTV